MDSLNGLMLAYRLVHRLEREAVERHADIDVMLKGISVADVIDHDVAGVPPA